MENYCNSDINPDEATLAVIRNVMTILGSKRLTGGNKAFINFTRNHLLSEIPTYLSKDNSVIEILEDVKVDLELLTTCRELKNKGYHLALDDFIWQKKSKIYLQRLPSLSKLIFKIHS